MVFFHYFYRMGLLAARMCSTLHRKRTPDDSYWAHRTAHSQTRWTIRRERGDGQSGVAGDLSVAVADDLAHRNVLWRWYWTSFVFLFPNDFFQTNSSNFHHFVLEKFAAVNKPRVFLAGFCLFFAETIWVIISVDQNGMLSLTQQMSSIPLGVIPGGGFDIARSIAFPSTATKNPFASNNAGGFPGHNSPTVEDDKSSQMEDAWNWEVHRKCRKERIIGPGVLIFSIPAQIYVLSFITSAYICDHFPHFFDPFHPPPHIEITSARRIHRETAFHFFSLSFYDGFYGTSLPFTFTHDGVLGFLVHSLFYSIEEVSSGGNSKSKKAYDEYSWCGTFYVHISVEGGGGGVEGLLFGKKDCEPLSFFTGTDQNQTERFIL